MCWCASNIISVSLVPSSVPNWWTLAATFCFRTIGCSTVIFIFHGMNSFINMLFQGNKCRTKESLVNLLQSLGFRVDHWNPYLFLLFVCFKVRGHCGCCRWCQFRWQREADSFLGKRRMIVFLMTLFFQCWLWQCHWQILLGHGTFLRKRVSWMFRLLPWLRNENNVFCTHFLVHSWGIPAYFFMLAPGPHEECKIKCYWKHSN